jgi:hypothetical protein
MKQNTINTLGVFEIKMGSLGENESGAKYKKGVNDGFHNR